MPPPSTDRRTPDPHSWEREHPVGCVGFGHGAKTEQQGAEVTHCLPPRRPPPRRGQEKDRGTTTSHGLAFALPPPVVANSSFIFCR